MFETNIAHTPVKRNDKVKLSCFAMLIVFTMFTVRAGAVMMPQEEASPTTALQQPEAESNLTPGDDPSPRLNDDELGIAHATAIANLKSVMAAIHAYGEAHEGELPPAVIPNDALPAEKRLSGLVLLLPYLEIDSVHGGVDEKQRDDDGYFTRPGDNLFAKLDLTKAWDDPANAEVANTIIPQFLMPFGADLRNKDGFANTHIALVRGSASADDGCFPLSPGGPVHSFRTVIDGTVNTVAIGEVHDTVGPWIAAGNSTSRRLIHPNNKGDQLTFSSDQDGIGYFANMDGAPFFLDINAASQKLLSAIACATDKELLPEETPEPRFQSRNLWRKANVINEFQGAIQSIQGVTEGDTLTINLGSADGLRKGVTFGVVSSDTQSLNDSKVTSTIKVIQIKGAHLAEAMIISPLWTYWESPVDNPDPVVSVGDKIYSPFWSPGRDIDIVFNLERKKNEASRVPEFE